MHHKTLALGRDVRRLSEEPPSTLATVEHISWCASRLLLAAQALPANEVALKPLTDEVLALLMRLQPSSATRELQLAEGIGTLTGIYWALRCHVAAQTVTEFEQDARPDVVENLRREWPRSFESLRSRIFAQVPVPGSEYDVAMGEFLAAQSAMTRDTQTLRGALDRVMTVLTPEFLRTAPGLDAAALLAGFHHRPGEEALRTRLLALLDASGLTSAEAMQLRQDIAAETAGAAPPPANAGPRRSSAMVPLPPPVATPAPPGVVPLPTYESMSRSSTAVPVGEAAGPEPVFGPESTKGRRKAKKPKKQRGFIGRHIDRLGESLGWMATPLLVVVIGACVVGVAGKAFEWLMDTSPVGNQSLNDWYKVNKAHLEQQEKNTVMAQPAAPSPAPTVAPAEPTGAPTVAPAAPASLTALGPVITAASQSAREKLAQGTTIAGTGGTQSTLTGAFTASEVQPGATAEQATVRYYFTAVRNGQQLGRQWIEARYRWNAGAQAWTLEDALWCLNMPGGPNGGLRYAMEPDHRAWARSVVMAP